MWADLEQNEVLCLEHASTVPGPCCPVFRLEARPFLDYLSHVFLLCFFIHFFYIFGLNVCIVFTPIHPWK